VSESIEQKLTQLVEHAVERGASDIVIYDDVVWLMIAGSVSRATGVDHLVPTDDEFDAAAPFFDAISGPGAMLGVHRVRGTYVKLDTASCRRSLSLALLGKRDGYVAVSPDGIVIIDGPVTPAPNALALQHQMETGEELFIADPLPYEASAAHSLIEPAI
jgi:hypothetical protein